MKILLMLLLKGIGIIIMGALLAVGFAIGNRIVMKLGLVKL